MGVRLVRYNRNGIVKGNDGTYKHDELENRDLANQHPIQAITNLQETLDELRKFNTINTNSIAHTWDSATRTLTSDVILNDSIDNAIIETPNGLFVDKYPEIQVEDTPTTHLYFNGKGMTLLEMYNEGHVFSHNGGTNNIYNTIEANAWYYDSSLGSFVQPQNTVTFTGFVSNDKYKYRTYTHKATFRSTNSDDDVNGLIIGYCLVNGIPHTLSAIVSKGQNGDNSYFQIWYNYRLNGQYCLLNKSNYPNGYNLNKGWDKFPLGITMYVEKQANVFSVTLSDWNSNTLNPSTTVSFDLNNYSWGHLFSGETQYGYCNYSQAYSYFTQIEFNGKGALKCDVKISKDKDNILEQRSDGLYVGNINSLGSGNQIEINQTSHNLIVGDIVYCDVDGLFKKALAEDSIKLEALGIVSQVVDADNFTITLSGLITGIGSGFSNGDVLYLSQTTEGTFSISQELTILKPIGIKIPIGVIINIQRATYMTTSLPDDTSSLVTYTH